MLIALNALQEELAAGLSKEQVITLLPMLGFPIDGVESRGGTTVFDVDITANRGDLMSHRGVGRELAAKLGVSLKPIPHQPLPSGEARRTIRLESPGCPIYATALLTLGKDGGTSKEAAAFLSDLGAGVKQMAAVDASNELLHRYGHPTHAFDAATLKGDITVRLARKGEGLTTLDGIERKLSTEDLVIADEAGPIALAGVMGGDHTKVTESTRQVLLESAYFDSRMVRLMSRRHGLHTDASARFGRGADPAMAQVARDLLVQRLQAWNGAVLEAAWSVGAPPPSAAPIPLDETMIARMGGERIPTGDILEALTRLGCSATPQGVVPPSWRHDLSLPEDLAEEVLRLRGYDRLPEALPPVQSEPEPLSARYLKAQRLARRLAHLGFHQTVTYGFISPEMDGAWAQSPSEGRALGNPLGHEYAIMRGSLLPSLQEAGRHNMRNGARELRLFEVAPTYASRKEGPIATPSLALVWSGTRGGGDPLTAPRPVHPLDVVAVIQDLGGSQRTVSDLGDGLYGMEVALDELPDSGEQVIPRFQSFSRFPVVSRDLSLLVPRGQIYGPLAEAMEKALPPECVDLRCVDIYRGKGLEPGTEAWLIRLTFQGSRTLTSEEVEGWVQGALEAARGMGARLRG